MKQAEKELLVNQIEHNIGLVKTFHQDKPGANELIEVYEEISKKGTSTIEAKAFVDDLNLFLGK